MYPSRKIALQSSASNISPAPMSALPPDLELHRVFLVTRLGYIRAAVVLENVGPPAPMPGQLILHGQAVDVVAVGFVLRQEFTPALGAVEHYGHPRAKAVTGLEHQGALGAIAVPRVDVAQLSV